MSQPDPVPSATRARQLADALLAEVRALRSSAPSAALDAAETAARDCAARLATWANERGYIEPPRPDLGPPTE